MHIRAIFVINQLKDESFRLGKWEKDVICGILGWDADDGIEESDKAKINKITIELSDGDKKRLIAGEIVPTWYIHGYCWNRFFNSLTEMEQKEDAPIPSRPVQCRTLKTLQQKGLIQVEMLGQEKRKFYRLTTEGIRIAEKLTNNDGNG